MAKLPTADDLPYNAPQTAMKTGSYTVRNMASPFSGLDKAGAELLAKAEKEADDRDKSEYYHAKTELEKAKLNIQDQLDQNPSDYLNREKTGNELLAPAIQSLHGTIRNPKYATMFADESGLDYEQFRMKQRDAARTQYFQTSLAMNDQDLETNKNLLMSAETVEEQKKYAERLNGLLGVRASLGENPQTTMNIRQAVSKSSAKGKIGLINDVSELDKLMLRSKPQFGPTNQNLKISDEDAYNIFATQESNNNPKAVSIGMDGKPIAIGKSQITPDTFKRFAQDGEVITDPVDNERVGKRIVAKYMKDYDGDIARVAVAYFSGEGNVSPKGASLPYIKNKISKQMNPKTGELVEKSVSSYVSNIVSKSGSYQPQQEIKDIYDFLSPDELRTEVIQRKSQLNTESAVRREVLRTMVDDNLAKASAGAVAPELPISTFLDAFPIEPDKAKLAYADYRDNMEFNAKMFDIAKQPPEIQQANLDIMKPDEKSPSFARELEQYQKYEKGVQTYNTMLAKDPIAYAESLLPEENIKPLDFSKPLNAQVADRQKFFDKQKNFFNISPKILSESETAILDRSYKSLDAKSAADLITSVTNGFTVEQSLSLAQELAGKDAMVLATAIAIGKENPFAAQRILQGDKSGIELSNLTKAGISSGLALMTLNGVARKGQIDAVSAYYKSLSVESGDAASAVFNKGRFETAVTDIFGRIEEFKPSYEPLAPWSKVFVPNSITQGRFKDIIHGLDDQNFKELVGATPFVSDNAAGRDAVVDIKTLKSNARLFSTGNGKYQFWFKTRDTYLPVTSFEDKSKPIEIDIFKLDKAMK